VTVLVRELVKTRTVRARGRTLVRPGGAAWEHVFVSIKGGPYARFRRAVEIGRLPLVYAAAAELPTVGLADALDVLALIAEQDRERYARAAGRWLGRYALEQPGVGLADLRLAVAACDLLPARPREALAVLRALVR
jgi:hypothetical protein